MPTAVANQVSLRWWSRKEPPMPHTRPSVSALSFVIPPRNKGHPSVLWRSASLHGSDPQTRGGGVVHTSSDHAIRVSKVLGRFVMAAVIGILGLWKLSQAAEFTCAGGDVACLIDAMNDANANGEENTITLATGAYTLTAVDNDTDGPNGLPSVTGRMTIRGAGA